ncbi:DDE-type integrase/transposase/recombinase [Modicisalibacter luteus]|uniref:DDE-type integrase/transposase/recombinase n=1 Tax=Modicisalibacter luteus TaxID=453962 RepID=A0ABV7M7G8_9GAMM
MPSVALRPDESWATKLIVMRQASGASLVVVIDCCTREILGWRFSDNDSSKTAEAALEEALTH